MAHIGLAELIWLRVLLYIHLALDSCSLHLINRKSKYFEHKNMLNLLFEKDYINCTLEVTISLHYAQQNLFVTEAISSLKITLTFEVRSLVFYTQRCYLSCCLLYF